MSDKKVPRVLIYADYPTKHYEEGTKVGVTLPYYEFIIALGCIPIMFTAMDVVNRKEELIEQNDILLMPGGADVDPNRYNEDPKPQTGRINSHYEWLDKNFARDFINNNKMVIGICRGMQSLNVMFGGSLHQHVIGHNQMGSKTAFRSDTDQIFYASEKNEVFLVNSIHHQAVKRLGENLEPLGFTHVFNRCRSLKEKSYKHPTINISKYYESLVDKIGEKDTNMLLGYNNKALSSNKSAGNSEKNMQMFVEAFRHKTLPIIAFQYHPEEFECTFATEEIKKMIRKYINGEYKNASEKLELSA